MQDLPATTRLAFVGDGPERAALQQEYAEMSNVKFMVRFTHLNAAISSPQLAHHKTAYAWLNQDRLHLMLCRYTAKAERHWQLPAC